MPAVSVLLHAFLCAAALSLSGYALYVARSSERDEDYEAVCDMGSRMSCSSVLTSRFSKGFGLLGYVLGEDHLLNTNNSLYGIAFYSCVTVLGCLLSRAALVLVIAGDLVVAANLVYLAYAMYYVLEELCLVCVTLDTVHLLLLAVHVHQYCNMEGRQKKKEE